jgi:hypothetical protein
MRKMMVSTCEVLGRMSVDGRLTRRKKE